MKMMSEHRVHS